VQTRRLSKKSQVTVPLSVRKAVGLEPGDLVGYDVPGVRGDPATG